jgi:rod shape determining protein RodA
MARFNLLARGKDSESWWQRQDWYLNAAAFSLSVIGLLLVWAASRPRLTASGGDPNAYLYRHAANIIIGLILGYIISRSKYTMLRAYAPVLYFIGCAGLVAVLLVGFEINGVKAWIQLPAGFTLQPSEFAKIALVLGMAMILAETRQRGFEPENRQVIISLALAALPLGLIMLQPDLGTAIVISVTVLGVLAVSGVSFRWMVGLLSVGLVVIIAVLSLGFLDEYQINRLIVFLDPAIDPLVTGYNIIQVKLAIGSGGFGGTGLFNGPLTNGGFVPEQQTDFIYSVAGEEMGFMGSATIIFLLAFITWRALRIARESSDLFGRIAASGVAVWLGFQTFENIGMNLGIMPITGVPLPFVSYGGTATFAVWMAVGLLQNIKSRLTD